MVSLGGTVGPSGHLVSSDGSPWPCWRKTEKSMWCAFWKNCVGPKVRGLSVENRCSLLARSVEPLLNFRNTRWPWTQSLAYCQDKLQRRFLSQFVHIEQLPGEEVHTFHRRRMRAIAALIRQRGTWSKLHARRVVAWASHLARPRNLTSLAAMLHSWRDSSWLERRRLDPDTGGAHRPGTRSAPGPVVKRWDEALEAAQEFLSCHV